MISWIIWCLSPWEVIAGIILQVSIDKGLLNLDFIDGIQCMVIVPNATILEQLKIAIRKEIIVIRSLGKKILPFHYITCKKYLTDNQCVSFTQHRQYFFLKSCECCVCTTHSLLLWFLREGATPSNEL
jgi:hypothetical protein